MMMHDYEASTWGMEAEELEVWDQPGNIPTQKFFLWNLNKIGMAISTIWSLYSALCWWVSIKMEVGILIN